MRSKTSVAGRTLRTRALTGKHRPGASATVRGVTRRTIFFPAWRATIGV